MRSLLVTMALLPTLCLGAVACLAAGPGELGATGSSPGRTLWAFPPAVEFTDGSGRYGLEVGLTPALWSSDNASLGARLGAFWYPEGGSAGAAIYAGITHSSTELGLWYVWRRYASERAPGDTRALSFRVGMGCVRSTGADEGSPGKAGFGAAIGFAF